MKVDTDIKQLAIVVALAVLIPFATRAGIKAFNSMQSEDEMPKHDKMGLYIAAGTGVLCMIVGSKIPVPSLAGGMFIGGLVTLIKALKCSWSDFEPMYRFGLLMAGILIAVFFALRGHMNMGGLVGRLGRKKRARKGNSAE